MNALLDLALEANLATHEAGVWRMPSDLDAVEQVRSCLVRLCDCHLTDDAQFRRRAEAFLGRGVLLGSSGFVPLMDLIHNGTLTPVEWGRAVSGPGDIRLLTGSVSKHSQADSFTLYRASESAPITDDPDVLPRIPRSLLPGSLVSPSEIQYAVNLVRTIWAEQVRSKFGATTVSDLGGFISYAKDLMDLVFWGDLHPLRSSVSPEAVNELSQRFTRFGLRGEDMVAAWRSLPSAYRTITRLSWGIRYLSNNLSNPVTADSDGSAFQRICDLPAAIQMEISARKTGQTLYALVRPIRILHRTLAEWSGLTGITETAKAIRAAVSLDIIDDKLTRRELAERLIRLKIAPPLNLVDALSQQAAVPEFPVRSDRVLMAAGCITGISQFFDSVFGHAYSEIRLALNVELDFKRRFNTHNRSPPQRYCGVWNDSIEALVSKVEAVRRSCLPAYGNAAT